MVNIDILATVLQRNRTHKSCVCARAHARFVRCSCVMVEREIEGIDSYYCAIVKSVYPQICWVGCQTGNLGKSCTLRCGQSGDSMVSSLGWYDIFLKSSND